MQMMPIVSYNFRLKSVDFFEKSIYQPDSTISAIEYDDQFIKIKWNPGIYSINFELLNKSDHTLKINWDEVVYIDEFGYSNRVLHTGANLKSSDQPQSMTSVARGSTLSDMIAPVNKIRLNASAYEPLQNPLLPCSGAGLRDRINATLGKSIRILFPVYLNGELYEYTFDLKIESYQKIRKG
jgi:hypothetical protein